MSTNHNSDSEMCEMLGSLLINKLTTTEDLEKMGFTEIEIKNAVNVSAKAEWTSSESNVEIKNVNDNNAGQHEGEISESCKLRPNQIGNKNRKVKNAEIEEDNETYSKRRTSKNEDSISMQAKRVRPTLMHNEHINNQKIEESEFSGSKAKKEIKKVNNDDIACKGGKSAVTNNNLIVYSDNQRQTNVNDAVQFIGIDLCVVREIAENITKCDDPKQATWQCLRQKHIHDHVRPNDDDDDDAEGGGALVLQNLKLA